MLNRITMPALPLAPPVALLLAGAFQHIGVREYGGNNHGEEVERYLRKAALKPGDPWCCAFISYVGYWALYDPLTRHSDWPLPLTGGCAYLGDWAKERGILTTQPAPGHIFLEYKAEKARLAHTGIVITVQEGIPLCIEGNTNNAGSRDGDAVLVKPHKLLATNGDRFVDWTKLLTPKKL